MADAPPAVAGVCDIDGSELYQRDDDREDVVRNRVAVFERDTMPVREHYRALGTPVVDDRRRPRPRRGRGRPRAAPCARWRRVILRKSRRELERMAAAGSVVAHTLALLRDRARPGVTTGELDRAAEEFIRGQGGVPTFKGYHGFPASICVSPNDMVVHGIPGAYALREGDVLSVDVGVTLRGWVADSGFTFWVGEGEPPEDVRRLLTACRGLALRGGRAVRRRCSTSPISATPCRRASRPTASASSARWSATAWGGACTRTRRSRTTARRAAGTCCAPGMTLAVEPMITASGVTDVQLDEDDGWSIYSADHSLTAHYEHTVAVTDDGPLILTRHEGWSPRRRRGRRARRDRAPDGRTLLPCSFALCRCMPARADAAEALSSLY